MKLNIRFQEERENISTVVESGDQIGVEFSNTNVIAIDNYDRLRNKPQINSVTLEGNVSLDDLGLKAIYCDTKENWDSQISLVSEAGAIYIYSNYETIYDDVGNPTFIAGLKIGDGNAYLIDIPFVTEAMSSALIAHIGNADIHITAAERAFWNNKVSAYMSHEPGEGETLVLSNTSYEKDGEIING